MRYRCVICKRDKFTSPQPHKCYIGFVKHFGRIAKKRNLISIWEEINED